MKSEPRISPRNVLAAPGRLPALFHIVNRLLPEDQVVVSVAPSTAAREALALLIGYDGKRNPRTARAGPSLFLGGDHRKSLLSRTTQRSVLHDRIESVLEGEMAHREIVPAGGSYAAKMIGWVEVSP